MKVSRFWLAGFFLASIATDLSAQGGPFCDRLDQAMAITRSDDAKAETVTDLLLGFGPSVPNCAFSIDLSGAKSANCHWAFSYRSDDSAMQFTEMLAELSACADPSFDIESDQHVNHPDFYDLRLLRITDGDVGLSLKDKVALEQTYVFIRLTPTQ